MNEIIKLDGLAISKQSVEQVRDEIRQRIEGGELDPVKVMSAVKFYEKVFNGDDKKNNGLNHILRPHVVDELGKDPHRKDYYGFKVEVVETGQTYNYDNCNDSELEELMIQKKELDAKIKARQDFLKSINGHLDVIQDGEAKTIYPPAKFSTTSAKFTLR
jgi:hypothetical protein